MNKEEIKSWLESFKKKRNRTIVIVDFGNVEKWKDSLKWRIGIDELGKLVKRLSRGAKFLRRFYYGSDYGKNERSHTLKSWSRTILQKARMSGFEVVTKRVKYIHNPLNKHGFDKKCDLDVEMTLDLIKEEENYDTIVLFSGDGDLACVLEYLYEEFGKEIYVFSARNHVAREIIDAQKNGSIADILYVENFEYRLNMDRFTP